ncbi:MAG TPA: sucrase ferredoxin [Acidimicrobiales bacterium]|nr:sucrase ferredoxin [Acidimicrobiales bacterium]
MTVTEPTAGAALRCAAWAREQGLDPIGSAGTYTGYLLVEWPNPWPRDLAEVSELAALRGELEGTGLRLQGLLADATGPEARVALYRKPEGPGFAGFARAERFVTARDGAAVAEAAAALLALAPDELDPPGTFPTELLVCTHGRRDRCCGSLGTTLALELLARPDLLPGSVRLWRTSHTGGHRFAPTAIVLPEGTVWGFLDALLLARVLGREGDVGDCLPHYRGCAGLTSAPVQALERAVLGEVGWGLLDWPRSGTEEDGGLVRLGAMRPDGGQVTFEGTVGVRRTVPVPDCGSPIEQAKKSEPEWEVSDLRRVD